MNRRARALIRGPGGRMAADAALLRPLGNRMVLEYDRAHVIVVEARVHHPCRRHPRPVDGLSHDHLHAARLRPPSPQARSPGEVHTRADASVVRRPAPGAPGVGL